MIKLHLVEWIHKNDNPHAMFAKIPITRGILQFTETDDLDKFIESLNEVRAKRQWSPLSGYESVDVNLPFEVLTIERKHDN